MQWRIQGGLWGCKHPKTYYYNSGKSANQQVYVTTFLLLKNIISNERVVFCMEMIISVTKTKAKEGVAKITAHLHPIFIHPHYF